MHLIGVTIKTGTLSLINRKYDSTNDKSPQLTLEGSLHLDDAIGSQSFKSSRQMSIYELLRAYLDRASLCYEILFIILYS